MLPRSRDQRTRIVLLGWYGSNNTGDEALAQVIVDQLKSRGFNDLVALSTNPAKTSAHLGIPSAPRSLFNLRTLRALSTAKALILGGGGLIQDGTSVYNLPIYAAYVALARLLGVQVIGWGLGVEPLWTLLGRLLTRFIVHSSAHFSVRDTLSRHLLLRAGVHPSKITVTADPAILLDPNPAEPDLPSNDKPNIVFCARHLPVIQPGLNLNYLLPVSIRHRLGIEQQADSVRVDAVVQALARGIEVAVHDLGANVELLALWPGRDDQMLDVIEDAALNLGVPPTAIRRAHFDPTPGNFSAYVGTADLLVSMRLHALIFAASQGVPMLAVSYARKVRGLMQELDAERWVVEVETRNPPPEELEMKLRLLCDTRKHESKRLKAAAIRARRTALQDAEEITNLLGCHKNP
jgi:polysaccharide pyruvyl transferase WcaK-like protein